MIFEQWATLVIVAFTVVSFLIWYPYRTAIACVGAGLILLLGIVSPLEAVQHYIFWNVIGLFVGTLVLAELFMYSKMPAVIAEYVVDQTKTTQMALLALCILSSLISIVVENVAVVLLLAPVTLKLCERLKVSPIAPLIFVAMFSNVQGTATLIGDPPSMILGGYLQMQFNDFFLYQGKISIFFFVQMGALCALAFAAWRFRKWTSEIKPIEVEEALSLIPSVLLVILIVLLATASHIDPSFKWFAGTVAIFLAAVGLLWHRFIAKWMCTITLVRKLDWDTTIFLMSLFILVGALEKVGLIHLFAEKLGELLHGDIRLAFIAILLISVLVSGVIDNVPYLLGMIPVVQKFSNQMEAPTPLLIFALLIGACLGGNMTPVGASANIVAVGVLKKHGHSISFSQYLKLGVPFTAAAVVGASVFLWVIWS